MVLYLSGKIYLITFYQRKSAVHSKIITILYISVSDQEQYIDLGWTFPYPLLHPSDFLKSSMSWIITRYVIYREIGSFSYLQIFSKDVILVLRGLRWVMYSQCNYLTISAKVTLHYISFLCVIHIGSDEYCK